MVRLGRRDFIQGVTAGTAASVWQRQVRADSTHFAEIRAQIEKSHDQSVRRLQDWIKLPSIAAENKGMNEGCELMMQLLRDAGFDRVTKIPTDGQPGVFATLDAGAPRTVGIYFMYDVKQVDPSEWSSPPWEARLVDKPGLGTVLMGRGAVNPARRDEES